jgi:hypothetical protein
VSSIVVGEGEQVDGGSRFEDGRGRRWGCCCSVEARLEWDCIPVPWVVGVVVWIEGEDDVIAVVARFVVVEVVAVAGIDR